MCTLPRNFHLEMRKGNSFTGCAVDPLSGLTTGARVSISQITTKARMIQFQGIPHETNLDIAGATGANCHDRSRR